MTKDFFCKEKKTKKQKGNKKRCLSQPCILMCGHFGYVQISDLASWSMWAVMNLCNDCKLVWLTRWTAVRIALHKPWTCLANFPATVYHNCFVCYQYWPLPLNATFSCIDQWNNISTKSRLVQDCIVILTLAVIVYRSWLHSFRVSWANTRTKCESVISVLFLGNCSVSRFCLSVEATFNAHMNF